MALKLVLFDFDGTLAHIPTDYARIRARLRDLFRPAGYDAEFGPILETIEAAALEIAPRVGSGATMNLKRKALAIVAEEEILGADQARPMEGVFDLFQLLAERHVPWAIVTRNHSACVRAVMARFEYPVPELLLARDTVVRVKPDPEAAQVALRRYGAKGPEAFVVGDTHHDVKLGKSVGARTILLEQPGARPVTDEPDHRVKTLHDVRAIIARALDADSPGRADARDPPGSPRAAP